MWITVDFDSSEAIYMQLCNQIVEAIAAVSYTHLDVYKRQVFNQFGTDNISDTGGDKCQNHFHRTAA